MNAKKEWIWEEGDQKESEEKDKQFVLLFREPSKFGTRYWHSREREAKQKEKPFQRTETPALLLLLSENAPLLGQKQ